MPSCSFSRCLFGTSATNPPYIDMSAVSGVWRVANAGMGLFFLVALTSQLNPYDWWLLGPLYAMPFILCTAIVVCPKAVDHPLWRVLCASEIVFGLIFLLYLFWIAREVATFGYLQNPLDFKEGRQCAGLAIAVLWAVICRLTAKNSPGFMVHVRLVTLGAILLSCIPMVAWSLCFYAPGQNMLPYCKRMLATGDKDI